MGVLLVVLFLVVPVLEIYVIIQVGQVIGAVPTVVLLIAESLLGAWLVKREGRRAWDALQSAIGSARLPSRELADGALIALGGLLLLVPGFVSDALALVLLAPPTRSVVRALLGRSIGRRAKVLRAGTAGRTFVDVEVLDVQVREPTADRPAGPPELGRG